MRIGVDTGCGCRYSDFLQQRNGTITRFVGRDRQVCADRLDQLLSHGHQRVEACQWILKNHRDPFAADPAQTVFGKIVYPLSVEGKFHRR